MQLKTAGDLRGFLAEVLVGIKDGTVDSNQAHAISKVAAQINQSLSTEVQARIHLKSLGADEAAGAMVIATQPETQTCAISQVDEIVPAEAVEPVQKERVLPIATEAPKNITKNITPPAVQQDATIALVRSLDEATANFRRNNDDAEKIWCDQCDMRVTTSQAVSCKSRHCKAKEAA